MAKHTDRCCLVTGGAQGIGKSIVQCLLAEGWQVMILDIDEEAGLECLAECGRERADFVRADVSNENDVIASLARTIDRFGHLHGLVNNAGCNSERVPVEQLSLEQWNRTIGVYLTGPLLMTKHAISHLRKTNGAVVNIASTRAIQSEPNTEAYAAAKGGVVSLTHSLAISLGPQIRVNCIAPGWIETAPMQKSSRRSAPYHTDQDREQHPAGRVGEPADIAHMASFLLGSKAGFITGETIVIDGGMTRKMIYAK